MQQWMDFIVGNWPLFLALVVIIVLLARTWLGPGSVQRKVPAEVVQLMNHQNALLVDVRTDKDFQQGHIANALHIPLGLLENRLAELQPYKETPIIFICRSGSRSSVAAYKLKKRGFETVHTLGGGMMAWESANLPMTTEATTSTAPPVVENSSDASEPPVEVEQSEHETGDRSVLIYSTGSCPPCIRAIELLDAKEVKYTEVCVDTHPERRTEMEALAGSSSTPQIFIGDVHVGGSDELHALDANNELDPLLGRA